jgi:hypothetical protein
MNHGINTIIFVDDCVQINMSTTADSTEIKSNKQNDFMSYLNTLI